MPKERERIHTKERNYLRYCRGEKELLLFVFFFQGPGISDILS